MKVKNQGDNWHKVLHYSNGSVPKKQLKHFQQLEKYFDFDWETDCVTDITQGKQLNPIFV